MQTLKKKYKTHMQTHYKQIEEHLQIYANTKSQTLVLPHADIKQGSEHHQADNITP